MELSVPLLFAAVVGFGHAFEADHLLAVSSIATKRNNPLLALKDGIYWGLGHTSTILLIGLIILVGKVAFAEATFGYFEAGVGVMLVILGVYRLSQIGKTHRHHHTLMDENDNHHLAYGIGLVHGLAGSGAMVLLVMTKMTSSLGSILYLLIFGIGSIAGMLLAAGIFSLPFSKKVATHHHLQLGLIVLSSILCIGYGGWVFMDVLGWLN